MKRNDGWRPTRAKLQFELVVKRSDVTVGVSIIWYYTSGYRGKWASIASMQ